jgi:hypothetical protein
MTEHHVLAEIAAKIAEIANDCFDRPTATRLRDLHAHMEQMLAAAPASSAEPPMDEQGPT